LPAHEVAGFMKAPPFPPKIVRLAWAPGYLGMDRNRFNREVRPYLTEIPLGKRAVGFDRVELDRWAEDYAARNGRPAGEKPEGGTWQSRSARPASSRSGRAMVGTSGTLT